MKLAKFRRRTALASTVSALASQYRSSSSRRRPREQGYVLLALILMVALMTVLALAVITPIKFELKREREEELIHRGVQYSRAIRNYYKKFGRYPTKLEDLDSTSNLRYLRKHYKDPITGKDFKLLHYGDPGVTLTGSIGGGMIPGANTVNSMNGAGSSAFGGSSFGNSGSAFGGSGVNGSGAFSQPSSFGGNSLGGNSSGGFGSSSNNSQSPSAQQGSETGTAVGTDSSQQGTQPPGAAPTESGSSRQTVFGGGPIVGVASTSKENSIREFNHKHKYDEWQFIYDPTMDRGALLTTPNQPALQLANQPLQNGQTGNANTNGSSFGQSGFGNNQSGFGNTGFGNTNSGGFSSPTQPQPPSNPPQQ
ncbi:MAG: hypothetical protein WBV69_11310 [Candidatus Sulfotelmatobacter sp.]